MKTTIGAVKKLLRETLLTEVHERVLKSLQQSMAAMDGWDPHEWANQVTTNPGIQRAPAGMFNGFVHLGEDKDTFSEKLGAMTRAAWGVVLLAFTQEDIRRMKDLLRRGEQLTWDDTLSHGGYLVVVKQSDRMPGRDVMALSQELNTFLSGQGGPEWTAYGEQGQGGGQIHLMLAAVPLGDLKRVFGAVQYQQDNLHNTEVGMKAAEAARDYTNPLERDYAPQNRGRGLPTVHADGSITYDDQDYCQSIEGPLRGCI